MVNHLNIKKKIVGNTPERPNQPPVPTLNIDPTFRSIDRLFVLSFKNGNNDPTRDSFEKW